MTSPDKIPVVSWLTEEDAGLMVTQGVINGPPWPVAIRLNDAFDEGCRRALAEPLEALLMCPVGLNRQVVHGEDDFRDGYCFHGAIRAEHRRVFVVEVPSE